ncbi:MAG: DMT family protein [Massilibacteroides sp.]|nr:DMT family protein [Massilibacteroides sp.]MDD3061431.1 DMT family protein [Massilibacteroides sp.]MDD4660241.1 DMT family protein [Massilibacteroides sp.]
MNLSGIYVVVMLVISNIFMTLAWYGHLKLKEMSWFSSLPLIGIILFSWGIAFFEYCFQVPANRVGFQGNGGPFSLIQLKVIQEVVSLSVFIIFTTLFFKSEVLKWNHYLAFILLILSVYLVFKK